MIVEILHTDEHIGVKAGQLYQAKRYWLDPTEKVTLMKRLTKKDRKPVGKELLCNEYFDNVRIIRNQS